MNNQNTILLHGGPKDGEMIQVSDSILQYRRLEIIIPTNLPFRFEDLEDMPTTITTKTGFYESKLMSEGKYGTCEHRTWIEWHWDGTAF